MLIDTTSIVPLAKLTYLFLTLLIVGTLGVLPLYKFNLRNLYRSSLFIKIAFWLPIFSVFVGSLYLGAYTQSILAILVIALAAKDTYSFLSQKYNTKLIYIYLLVFSIAILHFPLYKIFTDNAIGLLILVCFSSVLGDVTAFFMGNYMGRHKLPQFLNKNKSWEGVSGEVIGALIGVALVNTFIGNYATIWIFIPIGFGSAIGDLMNSYVKRVLKIKEWSNSIPGHGGYMDRFASLATSLALTFYWALFF